MGTVELKTDAKLLRALAVATVRTPSPDELRKQRVSFIYGSLDSGSNITRERIASVLDLSEGKSVHA